MEVVMHVERRSDSRLPYSGRAYITYAGRCRSDQVVELSRSGLKLKSSARIRPGRAVKVFLPLPARLGWRLCMLKGHVVRRERAIRGEDRLAIELIHDGDDNRDALNEYLNGSEFPSS